MNLKAVLLASKFALGQLESHIGNFGDAEETLTSALTIAEEHYGHNHPKVGVILTGVALMYRNKAQREQSSSILIQEGLFRKALDLMKAPSLDSEALVLLFTVPLAYDKYEDKIDPLGEKAMIEIKKQYAVLDAKVLSNIPMGSLKNKKKD